MGQISNILAISIIVFLFINLIINKKLNDFLCNGTLTFSMNKKTINIKVKKITINLLVIFSYISIIIICGVMIIDNLKYYFEDTKELDTLVANTKNNIQKETEFYKEIINKDYDIKNCKKPYIPNGFKYLEGTWNTGFVIQDENENQFVWVPCTNKKNSENIEILKKSNFSNIAFIKHFDCNEENYEEFLISSLENGGFYISRFEIGKDENGDPVSKFGYKIYNNITKQEAHNIANNMYENINSELINGYAYDTTFSWIINNEIVEITEKQNENLYSGTKSYKNIYDIVDNIYEFTTEESYSGIIFRGITIENKYVQLIDFDNRLSCSENHKSDNLTFRTILYK